MKAKLKGDRFILRRLFLECKLKSNEKDKHVDAIGVFCRTRVRVPPSPISGKLPENFSSVILDGKIDNFGVIPGGIIYNTEVLKPGNQVKIEK